MAHPRGGGGNRFSTKHTFDQVYDRVGSRGVEFPSTTGETIRAQRGMAKDRKTRTLVFFGERSRHGSVCMACWGNRIDCNGSWIGQCSEALDQFLIFESLPALAQVALQKLARAVIDVVPTETRSWSVKTADLDPSNEYPLIVNEVANWAGKGSMFIYYFQMTGDTDLSAVERSFSDAKKREGVERAYTRLNPQSHRQPPCLYVGSSKNLAQRFKGHLGYGSKTTYSLQLVHWARSLELELEFVCGKYSQSATPEVYQALEDTLWNQLEPMFGREGKR